MVRRTGKDGGGQKKVAPRAIPIFRLGRILRPRQRPVLRAALLKSR